MSELVLPPPLSPINEPGGPCYSQHASANQLHGPPVLVLARRQPRLAVLGVRVLGDPRPQRPAVPQARMDAHGGRRPEQRHGAMGAATRLHPATGRAIRIQVREPVRLKSVWSILCLVCMFVVCDKLF